MREISDSYTTTGKISATWLAQCTWYFSLIWNTYMWKLQTFCDISKFSQISITFNNFEISLVLFMPNITTNHAITCTNLETGRNGSKSGASRIIRESWLTTEDNYFIINHPNYELINCSFSCLLHPFVKFSVSERTGCTVDVVYFIDDIFIFFIYFYYFATHNELQAE